MESVSFTGFIQQNITAPASVTETICSKFSPLHIPAQSCFLQQGAISRYLFLEEGCMRAFTFDTEGREVTTGFYLPGQVVFEVASFFSRIPSQESIQALTDCRGFVISFEELNGLFHELPAFREFGRAMLVKGYVALKQRTLMLINETAEERYVRLLRENPEILQHAPLRHIATYLGITDTSLSRIRKAFSRKG